MYVLVQAHSCIAAIICHTYVFWIFTLNVSQFDNTYAFFCFTVCPEDFKFDPNGPFCHKAIMNSTGWVDASSTCQQNGAHLVSIETSQENAYLASTCKLFN